MPLIVKFWISLALLTVLGVGSYATVRWVHQPPPAPAPAPCIDEVTTSGNHACAHPDHRLSMGSCGVMVCHYCKCERSAAGRP